MRWLFLGISTFGFAAILLSAADDDNLPAGRGQDVVRRMCINCHGLAQVTSVKYTKKYWGALVDDMVSRGAEGSDEDVDIVVSYLSRYFGQPVNINSSSAKEIQDGLSFTAADADRIVKYRTDKGPFQSIEDLLKVPGLDAKLVDEQKKNIQF